MNNPKPPNQMSPAAQFLVTAVGIYLVFYGAVHSSNLFGEIIVAVGALLLAFTLATSTSRVKKALGLISIIVIIVYWLLRFFVANGT